MLASAYAVVDSSGAVASIVVTCGGTGYTTNPNVTIATPPSGMRAVVGSVSVSGGVITAITMSGGGGSGYGGSAADLHPIAINGTTLPAGSPGGVPTAYTLISANENILAPDNTWSPDMGGIWTFVADEANPTNPMTVSLYAHQPAYMSLVTPLSVPLGGTIGKTWTWNVPSNGGTLFLTLCVSGPSAASTAPWTLSNEFMASPVRGTGAAQTVDRTKPYATNPNLISWITSDSGMHPASIRLSGWGNSGTGDCNVVDPSDMLPATWFSWSLGPVAPQACAIQARAYSLSTSPHVWTNQNYPGTTAIGGGPATYAWTPASIGYLAISASFGEYPGYAVEIVTSAPHPFKTGQWVSFDGNAPSVSVFDTKTSTIVIETLAYFTGRVFVTSATTFVICGVDYSLGGSSLSTLNSSTNANWVVANGVGYTAALNPGAAPRVQHQCGRLVS